MNERYVEECMNFPWLQNNWMQNESGKPNNGRQYVEGYGLVNCPNLTDLLMLLGERFAQLVRNENLFSCAYFADDERGRIEVTDDYVIPELACLMVLKKVKGE